MMQTPEQCTPAATAAVAGVIPKTQNWPNKCQKLFVNRGFLSIDNRTADIEIASIAMVSLSLWCTENWII